MRALKLLPSRIHGILDYLLAAVLVIAPFVFQFHETSELAHWVSFGAGQALLMYSLATDYETSAFNGLRLGTHLTLDTAAGIGFVALALLAGFEPLIASFYGGVGAVLIIVVLVTFVPETQSAKQIRAEKDAIRAARFAEFGQ